MSNAEKKIALVTGASRGIGQAIADSLVQSGFLVIGTATTEAGAQAITERLNNLGGKDALGVVLNVEDRASIDEVVAKINQDIGAPTILVNNAGKTRDNLVLRMSDDEWQNVIDVDLSAVFYLTKACLRGMLKAKWGRIVQISSVVAAMGNAGQVNYSAAKAGLLGLTKSLALELGSRQITVNAIAPGFIETDMTDYLTPEQRNILLEKIALKRFGQAKDIADAVDFLVSDRASYITGETLHINGGMYMV